MSLNDAFGLQVLKTAEEATRGWKMMIGGKWVESRSGKRMTSMNPAYDEAVAEVPAGNAEDIQLAVEAGKAAFPAWSKMHVDDRAKHCRQFANAVRGMSRELGLRFSRNATRPSTPPESRILCARFTRRAKGCQAPVPALIEHFLTSMSKKCSINAGTCPLWRYDDR